MAASAQIWRPQREWAGERCAIVAAGPSAAEQEANLERIRRLGFRFIAINEAYELVPWADIIYFCDYDRFWLRHRDRCVFQEHPGRKVTINRHAKADDPSLLLIENWCPHTPHERLPALVKTSIAINRGNNAGYQALGLLWHLTGPSLWLLVGYDMREVNGRSHAIAHADGAFQSEQFRSTNGREGCSPDRYEQRFAPIFPRLAQELKDEGVKVINCTTFDAAGHPSTALTCFPIARL